MDQIIKGRQKKPFNLMLIGTPGIGKSTFAANAPKPIFLGGDELGEIEADKFPGCTSYPQFITQLSQLIANPQGYKTVVVDTIDSIEKLLHTLILAGDPKKTGAMMSAYGGYGKAYEKAASQLIEVREKLKTLRDKHSMNVIILCHSKKVKVTDTVLGLDYDSFETNLHKDAQAIFVDWVSAVLFSTYIATGKEGANSDKVFAMGHGQRTVYTEKRPGHLAKNRYELPYQMDLDFGQFYDGYEAFYAGHEAPPAQLIESINGLLKLVTDEALLSSVNKTVEANKDNPVMLRRILLRVQERTGMVVAPPSMKDVMAVMAGKDPEFVK